MNLTHDGLTLWYGTPDAPGPFDEEVTPRSGVALIVGVHPANPTNAVEVQYRVDRGMPRFVSGRQVRTDHQRGFSYFSVVFPNFITGDVVEYVPILSCGGRQVPAPQRAARFRSRFRLAPKDAKLGLAPAGPGARGGRA